MIIDTHAHLMERSYIEALTAKLGLEESFGPEGSVFLTRDGYSHQWYRPGFFDLDARIARMDAGGVDARILCLGPPNILPWEGEEQVAMARRTNDDMAAVCKAYPGRFHGLVNLPLSSPQAALAELDRAMGLTGMIGIAMGSNAGKLPLDHTTLEPVWARINDLRIPVFEHPLFPPETEALREFELHIRVGFIYETTTALTRLIYSGIFERYPDFPFIVAHTGGALLTLVERLDNGFRLFPECRKYIDQVPSVYVKQLYYDTAAFYAPALRMALDVVGPERLLWGTDDPIIAADQSHVTALGLPADQEALILGGNAARIFGLGDRS